MPGRTVTVRLAYGRAIGPLSAVAARLAFPAAVREGSAPCTSPRRFSGVCVCLSPSCRVRSGVSVWP